MWQRPQILVCGDCGVHPLHHIQMKPSTTKNKVISGIPYCIVELGDILYFSPKHQYEVTGFSDHNAHPMSGDVDLFQLEKDLGICPIVMEK